MLRLRHACVFVAGCLVWFAVGGQTVHGQSASSILRWAGDPEGGAPFVQADPRDPSRLEGFDVEVAQLLARGVGRTPQFVLIAFASLDQSISRGDADVALSGIEDTPARRGAMAPTIPYYEFREVLTVRTADATRVRGLADLRGRRVATLGGTIAYDILLASAGAYDLDVRSYDDDVHPYEDLVVGRVDAVLLDHVLAERRTRALGGVVVVSDAVAIGHYVGVLSAANAAMRDTMNDVIRRAMRDGSLEAIFRKWHVWNDDQVTLYERLLAGRPVEPYTLLADGLSELRSPSAEGVSGPWALARSYLPALLEASLVTIGVSCLAMVLAVCVGVLIATGRVYGGRALRALLVAYVELIRGTPVLLQLFVLYYGLASAIRLPAFLAALLGLALNYAAYESEIYRSALEAVPPGQLDAARMLGLSERQILTFVRGPQALRLALAPMTNDFVALLKDSSLVSVLTVMELTKQTQIYATNTGSWVVPGLLCAGLYLSMSLPIAALARRLERQWKAPGA